MLTEGNQSWDRKDGGGGQVVYTSSGLVTRLYRKIQGSLTRSLKDHSRRKLKGRCLFPVM